MNNISTSIMLMMLLFVAVCALISTVLIIVAVRYLGQLVDQGNLAEDRATRDAAGVSIEQYPAKPEVGQITQVPTRPEGMRINTCGREVHPAHTWTVRNWSGREETAWCPGMTEEQDAEAARLAKREAEMYHPDYVPPFGLRAGTNTAARAGEGETIVNVPPKPSLP